MQGIPINIDNLVHSRSVEDNRREFKAAWNNSVRDSTVRTVCAFANDLLNLNGGYVVLGIESDDSERIPFCPRAASMSRTWIRMQREIRGQCNRIDPDYQPLLFPEQYHGKSILIVWAPGGDNRPYQAPKRGNASERAYYVRQRSSTVEATGGTLTQLIEQAARIPFDDRRRLVSAIEDISPNAGPQISCRRAE